VLAEHGYPPLPEFEEPPMSPRSRPELARRFPLILTCAKSLRFCESQHRIDTPHGSVRARGRLNAGLDPGVVSGQHGWWQACAELGLPGYPPYGPGSANLNLVLRQAPSDPIGESSPLRSSMCEIAPLPQDESTSA
jgi:hypothetical protein